ncbi:hypothetical protein CLIB1444_16S01596 [[Candida] jaroonii]|uniref:Uncharacterized protein n=1 Tax=[Candida] jaroonii TaxID=467808 RepID=A0ACA9YEP2_9ASCO|nr:hypothetical protein CLIB1444_16S01596 [[Candida] jaroonii]
MIESTLSKLAQEVKEIQDAKQKLQDENDLLKLKIIEMKKDYTRELVDMKRLYKIQHKQHVKTYQDKIDQLTLKIRKMHKNSSESSPRNVLQPKDMNRFTVPKMINKPDLAAPSVSTVHNENVNNGKIKVKTTEYIPGLPYSQYENPDIIPTQYSTDSDIEGHISPIKQEINSPSTSQVFHSSPVKFDNSQSQPTRNDDYEDNEPKNVKRQKIVNEYDISLEEIESIFKDTTPLFQRHWMSKYYENKFTKVPDFKIDLTENPITRKPWNINDFTRKFEISETPPFFYIKDNTSQEDRITKMKSENDLKKTIRTRLNQIFTGENYFLVEILNKYVKADRYIIDKSVLEN